MKLQMIGRNCLAWLSLVAIIASCASTDPSSATPASSAADLHAVATTTIVGDVVSQIAGDTVSLTVMLPPSTDVHGYQPTPQDVAMVADADVVFVNGLGLEQFMDDLVANAGGEARIVTVSDGIEAIDFKAELDHEESADAHPDDEHAAGDPHIWTDPVNLKTWVDNIVTALSELNPAEAAVYAANAQRYRSELDDLDAWVRDQVAKVPEANRKIVTDHQAFGYFAQRYGFVQVGAVVPGYSTSAEPSAQELAALEDAIRAQDVKAIFVGDTVNPNLAQRVAADTGVQLVFILTGSLTNYAGKAPTYLDYMHYNVSAFVGALE